MQSVRARPALRLLTALVVLTGSILAVTVWLNRDAGALLYVEITGHGEYALDVPPSRKDNTTYGWWVGSRGDLRVEKNRGAAESDQELVARMLEALEYRGRILDIHGTDDATSEDGCWRMRMYSAITLLPDGRLDALHLLTAERRDEDWTSPYLLRARGRHGSVFRGVVSPDRLWQMSLPSLRSLSPDIAGFRLVLESHPDIRDAALLREWDASAFVFQTSW